MLFTRKGDNGTSGLFGTKNRLPKDSPAYEALGAVDELNSLLGVCRARARKEELSGIEAELMTVQESLFIVQAELAGADKSIHEERIEALEDIIASIENEVGNPHSFIVPGATELSAFLDLARSVSRRAERAVIRANATNPVSSSTRAYLNRLSSLLYALARHAAYGTKEVRPSY